MCRIATIGRQTHPGQRPHVTHRRPTAGSTDIVCASCTWSSICHMCTLPVLWYSLAHIAAAVGALCLWTRFSSPSGPCLCSQYSGGMHPVYSIDHNRMYRLYTCLLVNAKFAHDTSTRRQARAYIYIYISTTVQLFQPCTFLNTWKYYWKLIHPLVKSSPAHE